MKLPVDRDTPTDTGLGAAETDPSELDPHSQTNLTTHDFQKLSTSEQLLKLWELYLGLSSRVYYDEKRRSDFEMEIREYMREIEDLVEYMALCQTTIMHKQRITPPPRAKTRTRKKQER